MDTAGTSIILSLLPKTISGNLIFRTFFWRALNCFSLIESVIWLVDSFKQIVTLFQFLSPISFLSIGILKISSSLSILNFKKFCIAPFWSFSKTSANEYEMGLDLSFTLKIYPKEGVSEIDKSNEIVRSPSIFGFSYSKRFKEVLLLITTSFELNLSPCAVRTRQGKKTIILKHCFSLKLWDYTDKYNE